ncbi:hypothetical protein H5T51_06020, partial [Candidatus Bathyarchaeota archaeon]|nr:hypothetical protein [Candidatus Bathyarchaeota archaeon]
MNKIISAFTGKLGAKIVLEDTLILKEKGKLFLLNMELKKLIQEIGIKPIYAGVYLGSQKQKRFVPSFPLLFMIADKAEKKVFLNDKAAWLFVCGRDIFSEGILHVEGPVEKG